MAAHDPYAEHSRDEELLRALLFGAAGAGALGALRRIPKTARIHRMIRRRDAVGLQGTLWWTQAWATFHVDLRARLKTLSRSGARAAMAETGATGVAKVDRQAATLARLLTTQAKADTAAGLVVALGHLPRRASSRELRQQLSARIGGTPAQLENLRAREVKALSRFTAGSVLRKVRKWAKADIVRRAVIFAGTTVVEAISRARRIVFKLAGVLVFSDNPLDKATRPQHRTQTEVTRETPTRAGSPWADGAPFSGLPPYGPLCRCVVRPA